MAEFSENGSRKQHLSKQVNSGLREFSFRNDTKNIIYLLKGSGLILAMAMVFYNSLWAVPFLSPLLVPIMRRSRRQEEDRRRKEVVNEFKDCMNSVLTSLKAGNSAENAFREAEGEMAFLYGERCAICEELKMIACGLDNNVPLETLLVEFAQHIGAEEIQDFAEVFSIAKRSGGNMSEILGRTILQIQNRIDVEREISIMISSSRMEQNIMDIVPFAIIAYIRLSSDGFMDVLYGNVSGILIMTICLFTYLAAFLLSEKIVAIKV